MAGVQFATCSYPEFQDTMGIPVRATVGAPRFRLDYVLAATMWEAAPERRFMNRQYADFRQALRAKLDSIGIERFIAAAQAVADRRGTPDGTIVLLCFENSLNKKGWCHRRMVAEWLEENGHPCPEVGTLSPDDPSLRGGGTEDGGEEEPPFESLELF